MSESVPNIPVNAGAGPETTVECNVTIYHWPNTPNEHYLQITGELFGPFQSEEDAVAAVSLALARME